MTPLLAADGTLLAAGGVLSGLIVPGPTFGPGIVVPAGSLDRFYAARDAAAQQLVEIVVFGNSTLFGETTSGPFYSPVQRIREDFDADGYADGGHGNLNGAGDVTSAGDSLAIVAGFAGSDTQILPGESGFSTAGGDEETFTRLGRFLVLWYGRFNTGGRFSYEIDGGGEIIVDPPMQTAGGTYNFVHTGVIDTGSDGSHTITVRNKGGRLVTAPTNTASTSNGTGSGGTLAPGTYEYAAALQTSDGKIGPLGPIKTVTIAAGQVFTFVLSASPANLGTTTNIYRRLKGVGNFQLVGSVATNANGAYSFTDTGAAAGIDYAQSPDPVLNPAMARVNVATIMVKSAGIVLHNFSARGSNSNMAADPFNLALALGLDLDPPHNTTAAINRALDATPGALHPVLAIFGHGINDQQQGQSPDILHANTVTGIQTARHVNVDAMVLIPGLEAALNSQNAPQYRAALQAAADDEAAARVDIGMGGALPTLTAGSTNNNPHLSIAQYQTQGDYIYTVLGS